MQRLDEENFEGYAADLPDGQKFFTEFIAKLQLKYPEFGSKEL